MEEFKIHLSLDRKITKTDYSKPGKVNSFEYIGVLSSEVKLYAGDCLTTNIIGGMLLMVGEQTKILPKRWLYCFKSLPTAIELQEHSDYEVMLIGSAYSESMGQSADSVQKVKKQL